MYNLTLKKIIFAVIFLSTSYCFSQEIISIGPMYHLNIGDKSLKSSFGLEVAYWNINNFPYSIDLGIDFQKGKFRVYSEAQTGVGFAGVSLGPVIEFKKNTPMLIGLQTSGWINYLIGVDFRYRFFKGPDYIVPGVYLKYPWLIGNKNTTEGSSNHNNYDWD